MSKYDTIIIGSGPAGLTAGIYCGRYKLKTLILESYFSFPQIVLTDTIENYPGFPEGIDTNTFLSKLKDQAKKFDVEFLVINQEPKIELLPKSFNITVEDKSLTSSTIILATGRRARPLGIDTEQMFVGRGVSYCGICDAPLYKGKTVAVVGGGDTALHETIYISKFVKKLYLIHRRETFRGAKILQEKVFALPNVEIITSAVVEQISGKDTVEEITIRLGSQIKKLSCDGIFIFIGEIPNTEFVRGIVELTEEGYIITDEHMRTSKEGIFAAGDCRKSVLKQVITACADGAIAATSVREYIETKI